MNRPRNPRGEGDQLRDDLLDAAEALLAELEDEQKVTIRAIVKRVGVTPPALYLHFDSKEALIEQVLVRRFMALGAATIAAAQQEEDAAGALRAGCLAYLDWGRENPGGYAVLFSSRRATHVDQVPGSSGSVAFDGLVEGVQACQEHGQARAGDPRRMAALVWASLHGLATLTTQRPQFPWPALGDMLDDLLEGVVGVPARR